MIKISKIIARTNPTPTPLLKLRGGAGKKLLGLITLFFAPLFASAAGVGDIIDAASGIVSEVLIPLAFALALFYFFWGVAKYIRTSAGDEKGAEEGKRIMIWGIVGLFVAFSIWGIITFIQSELGIPEVQNPAIPGDIITTKIY